MVTPVLATKFFIPPSRARAVPRARLVETLNQGRDAGQKLTLVSAPAGFGKTTLLSEWVGNLRRREPRTHVAWISLDEGDNDPTRFLAAMLAAMRRAETGDAVTQLDSTPGAANSLEPALIDLINDLAQQPDGAVLLLDDFQSIEAPAVRDALTFLLDHQPASLHIVIASRSDPLLPVARLRASGDLNELRADDLRFSPDEAVSFLNEVMDLGLATDDIAALETRTEGWIAGLQLAALSMRERSDISGFIQAFTGSNRFVIDYLGEEVLQQQPDHVRTFLLRTAFLDRLSGALCDAVTGGRDSGALLDVLDRDNLFLVPLDERSDWRRYHHLFADVLRARALREDRDGVETRHRLASDWYEKNDLPEDAVKHALAAGDFSRAAHLMEMALPELRRRRHDATLMDWLRRLPDATVRRMPVLNVYYAWSLLVSGDLAKVEERLQDAESALAGTGEVAGASHESAAGNELETLPVMIAVYRSALAQAQGDLSGATDHARRALELTQPGDHQGRGAAAGLLALALWSTGDLDTAIDTFASARAALALAGNTADTLGSAVLMADMLLAQGRRRDAHRTYEQAMGLAAQHAEIPVQSVGDLHVGVSEMCREQDDLAAANAHLAMARRLGEGASLPENRHRWFVAAALVRVAEGEFDAALALLSQAERLQVPGFAPNIRPIAAVKARVWAAQGNLSEALSWAESQRPSLSNQPNYLSEYEHLTFARILIAQHRTNVPGAELPKALSLLQKMLTAAQMADRTGSELEILVILAIAHHAAGRRSEAVTTLSRALAVAEPEGYVRLFADEGPPMRLLLEEASRRGIAPGYTDRLRRAMRAPRDTTPHTQMAASTLSEREFQVLRLLATELNGPQIASELYVSLNTLRTHTKHIFGKLGVNSRAAAVRRARELGIL